MYTPFKTVCLFLAAMSLALTGCRTVEAKGPESGNAQPPEFKVVHADQEMVDAAKFCAGDHTITLSLAPIPPEGIVKNFPYCSVMYDAIRLELE